MWGSISGNYPLGNAMAVTDYKVIAFQIKGLDGQVKHKADEYEGGLLKVYRFLHMKFKHLNVNPEEASSFELPQLEEDKDA